MVIRKITLICLSYFLLESVCNNRLQGARIMCIVVIVIVPVFIVEKSIVLCLGGSGFLCNFVENCIFMLSIIDALIMFKIVFFKSFLKMIFLKL